MSGLVLGLGENQTITPRKIALWLGLGIGLGLALGLGVIFFGGNCSRTPKKFSLEKNQIKNQLKENGET